MVCRHAFLHVVVPTWENPITRMIKLYRTRRVLAKSSTETSGSTHQHTDRPLPWPPELVGSATGQPALQATVTGYRATPAYLPVSAWVLSDPKTILLDPKVPI